MTSGAPRGRLLGIDWGEKRIRIALSDESRAIAQPLTTLTRRSGKLFPMRDLLTLAGQHATTGFVFGLPLKSDGSDAAPAAAGRPLAAEMRRAASLPVTRGD